MRCDVLVSCTKELADVMIPLIYHVIILEMNNIQNCTVFLIESLNMLL